MCMLPIQIQELLVIYVKVWCGMQKNFYDSDYPALTLETTPLPPVAFERTVACIKHTQSGSWVKCLYFLMDKIHLFPLYPSTLGNMQIKRVVSLGLYTKECVTHNYPRLLSTAEEKHTVPHLQKIKRHKQSHTQTTFIVSILILLYKRVL